MCSAPMLSVLGVYTHTHTHTCRIFSTRSWAYHTTVIYVWAGLRTPIRYDLLQFEASYVPQNTHKKAACCVHAWS